MRAIGQASVELAIDRLVKVSLVESRKSDAENSRRLIDIAMHCGDLQRQLADERVENLKLLNENESLRENLEREREQAFLLTGTEGNC